MNARHDPTGLDPIDRAIVLATQDGLPITSRPYHTVARMLGLRADDVMMRMERMREAGVIRRIGVVPNHYAIGYTANGMTVWDVDDAQIDDLGMRIGALDCVSHCYQRPRHPPAWTYNLFAMVHGHDRAEVEAKAAEIGALLGAACRASDILYSTRILKKTGLRLAPADTPSATATAASTPAGARPTDT